jgi:hypothetical protein
MPTVPVELFRCPWRNLPHQRSAPNLRARAGGLARHEQWNSHPLTAAYHRLVAHTQTQTPGYLMQWRGAGSRHAPRHLESASPRTFRRPARGLPNTARLEDRPMPVSQSGERIKRTVTS